MIVSVTCDINRKVFLKETECKFPIIISGIAHPDIFPRRFSCNPFPVFCPPISAYYLPDDSE